MFDVDGPIRWKPEDMPSGDDPQALGIEQAERLLAIGRAAVQLLHALDSRNPARDLRYWAERVHADACAATETHEQLMKAARGRRLLSVVYADDLGVR